jgi:hypothetical protein
MALKKNETKQAKKRKGKKKKKKAWWVWRQNEELELSYIPVLAGYLNFLNNLWFWF